jgi:hypothetical protein
MPVRYAPPLYAPAPMPYPPPMAPAPARPTVFVYGPLTPMEAAARPVAANGQPLPGGEIYRANRTEAPSHPAARSEIQRTSHVLTESCGPDGCDPLPFGPEDHVARERAHRGHGHFIGEVAAYFLVPIFNPRLAATTTSAGAASEIEFPSQLEVGPRVSFGYLWHTGWGVRANFFYLNGSTDEQTSNADPATVVATPGALPFQLVSPSLTLQQGIGIDQFAFRQRLELTVLDLEVLKETQCMDTTFLWNFGARYARVLQSYSASRTNPGGINGANIVNADNENLDQHSTFEGWGPTFGVDIVHRLSCHFALYGSIRGSFLFGVERFQQTYASQRNSIDAGVANFTALELSLYETDRRVVPIGEFELGLQCGKQCGRCYIYGRAGAVYQRWWDVGNPSAIDGSLSLVGAAARFGITY